MIKVIIDILQKNQIHTFGKISHSCVANEENQSGKPEDNMSIMIFPAQSAVKFLH